MAVQLYFKAVADPDLQMRGGGGVHPAPEISGGGGTVGCLKKIFFQPLGPQCGLKIRRYPGPPVLSPGFVTRVKGTCALKIKQWDF